MNRTYGQPGRADESTSASQTITNDSYSERNDWSPAVGVTVAAFLVVVAAICIHFFDEVHCNPDGQPHEPPQTSEASGDAHDHHESLILYDGSYAPRTIPTSYTSFAINATSSSFFRAGKQKRITGITENGHPGFTLRSQSMYTVDVSALQGEQGSPVHPLFYTFTTDSDLKTQFVSEDTPASTLIETSLLFSDSATQTLQGQSHIITGATDVTIYPVLYALGGATPFKGTWSLVLTFLGEGLTATSAPST